MSWEDTEFEGCGLASSAHGRCEGENVCRGHGWCGVRDQFDISWEEAGGGRGRGSGGPLSARDGHEHAGRNAHQYHDFQRR